MKHVFTILALAAFPLFANAEEGNNFDTHKAEMTENIDRRIASLTKMKECVQGAADQGAVKTCRETHRTEMDGFRDANIDSKIQKLQERKAKRAQKNH